ncbi:MAG: FtsX-like permease family protein, partial [Bacteroidota bacterium]
IGMRKAMGGVRQQLVLQFLTESIVIVFIATAIAIGFYPLLQPFFEQLIGKNIPGISSFPTVSFFILPVFVLLVGLLAGLYPSFVLSSVKSIDSLKGKLTGIKENVLLRKTLVGVQFCIAAVVMIASVIVSQQVAHFFSKNLGYNKEYIVSSQVPRDWSAAGVRKMRTVRNEFAAMPQVSHVSLSYEIPNGNNGGQPGVYKAGTDSVNAVSMQAIVTDENYLATYQIPLQAGAFFRNEADSLKVVINKVAANALGYKNAEAAIGQQIKMQGSNTLFTVQGVVADFHFNSMQQKIAATIFLQPSLTNTYRFLSFKLKPGNIGAAIAAIEKKWAVLLPGSSFEYRFMDDVLKKLYASEIQMKKAAYGATALAGVIVLLGVLGLISLSVQKRTKEIGIRKVLGASASNIIALFLKDFLPVLVVGGLLAIPASWYIMHK